MYITLLVVGGVIAWCSALAVEIHVDVGFVDALSVSRSGCVLLLSKHKNHDQIFCDYKPKFLKFLFGGTTTDKLLSSSQRKGC